ncbi:outer membrane N-deacetylase [Saccharicrinis fermentans DSM 9555 = JCM 21142]|uniref:Outer membrane N-deacetylase n=2 Tax=Saccharicrinis fermentans TaxID=982 RepID=W7Y6K7_9BACT|nr:outer membrane N-deacetylase [Saccharicrinis fermentans DSM 9555 = JCM 21142]
MSRAKLIHKTHLYKLFRPWFGGVGHVIMFHRIFNEDERLITKGLQVSQDYLENIIKHFIAQKIDIVSLDECYRRLTTSKRSKRFVTITFDDGYLDNLTHALPVFEKYKVPFSVFVTTGFLNDTSVMWWYLMEDLILNQEELSFSYGTQTYEYSLRNDEEKRTAFAKIKTLILKCKNKTEYMDLLKTVIKNTDVEMSGLNQKLMLCPDQVRMMSDHPLVTIGAHTVHHMALSAMTEDDAVREMKESIAVLEQITNKKMEYFAYPYGTAVEAGQREFDIARRCNLKMAFTTEKRNISRHQAQNIFSIPRLGINSNLELEHIDFYMNGMSVARDMMFGI